MSKERKPTRRKKPATPKGDFWNVVRVKSAQAWPRSLTDDHDHLSKDEARVLALSAFLHGETVRVYIKSRTTGEEIDLTTEMRKVEVEYRKRMDLVGGSRPRRPGEIEEIIRAVLPEGTPPELDEGA